MGFLPKYRLFFKECIDRCMSHMHSGFLAQLKTHELKTKKIRMHVRYMIMQGIKGKLIRIC